MPKSLAFNLHWACYLPTDTKAAPVQLTKLNIFDRRKSPFPGVILYPAAFTPEIITVHASFDPSQLDTSGDITDDVLRMVLSATDRVEILLLSKSGTDITPSVVNRRLKLCTSKDPFNPLKFVNGLPLFDEIFLASIPDLIRVTSLGALAVGRIYKTESRFKGVVDKRIVDHYTGKGYDTVFAISVDATMLLPTGTVPSTSQNAMDSDGVISPFASRPDDQDKIVFDFAKVDAPKKTDAKNLQFAFNTFSDDVAVGTADISSPVIAYHPLFFYLSLGFVNIAHLSDIHCSARQRVLRLSKARVIENEGPTPIPGSVPIPGARPVGDMLNICSQNARDLFKRLGSDVFVDAVVIGGDLIDYLHSLLPDSPPFPLSVVEIWDQVDAKSQKQYFDNTDLVTFYTFIVDWLHHTPKPLFGVSGNHDYYFEPYGITPRAIFGLIRANAGIPADHNLTFYEAILSFGPTFDQINSGTRSSFIAEKVKWFYMVFTPFSDFTVELPNQRMICLGWGESEKLIDLPDKGQGNTHLPRADETPASHQLQIVKQSLDDGKKIILTTHFTFVSYDNPVSNADAAAQAVEDGGVFFDGHFSRRDMGTFDLNRRFFYNDLIASQRKLQLVLTGHSHRRGFHTVRKALKAGGGVSTCMFDYPPFDLGTGKPLGLPLTEDTQEPWVILSDCGGPLPRRSISGEFNGWGSDLPAATRITFNPATGNVLLIDKLQVNGPRSKPRFVVSLDYLDIQESVPVITDFSTDDMLISDQETDAIDYFFNLTLNARLTDPAGPFGVVSVEKLFLLHCERDGSTLARVRWRTAECTRVSSTRWAAPTTVTTRRFLRQRFLTDKNRETFVAITFKSTRPELIAVYNFDSPWTFEVNVSQNKSGGVPIINPKFVKFIIQRDSDSREKPDLTRRKKYPEYKLVPFA